MRGAPAVLATKSDVTMCVNMAQSGDLPKADVIQKLQALSDDEQVWTFDSTVDSSYSPASDEKVMTETVDGVEVYTCFKLADNPNSKLNKIGMTKAEVQALINNLQ